MVDIHSHILPKVDDGASDLAEAIEMLNMASISTTRAIVLTPHSNLYDDQKNLIDYITDQFDAFKKHVKERDVDIDLYLGCELYCHGDFLKLCEEKKIATINGSRFLLIEFDFFSDIDYITDSVKALSQLGYVPIVAHPERYECIKANNSHSLSIMENGGLLQLNKGSILGDFGVTTQKTAFNLLNHKSVQFVASDAHSVIHRTTEMELAFDIISDEVGAQMAEALFKQNPNSVISNGSLVISKPLDY